MSVPEHEIGRVLHDDVIDPSHADRTESPAFEAAKKRLHEDGHYQCWICSTTTDLQVHHFLAEYMFKDLVDFGVMKDVAEALDVYGYGRLLKNVPITDPEDIRCFMVLCQPHHTGVDHGDGGSGTGIHEMTFPSWIMQKLAQKGLDPIPQPGETFVDMLKRLVAPPKGSA